MIDTIYSKGANGFAVNLQAEGFTEDEVIKLSSAVSHFADAVGSEQFKLFCLNFYYFEAIVTGRLWNKKTTYQRRNIFRFNNGLSKDQIYAQLMAGSEKLQPVADMEADIHLIIDRRNKKSVLGYTYANTSSQWVYNYFFRNGTVEDVAGNLGHEWCHKMGFDHEFSYNPLRDKTVPYAVGYFIKHYRKDLTWEQILIKMYA